MQSGGARGLELRTAALKQCFPNLSWRTPCPAHFVCLPNQTHPIQALQSLLTSWGVESGVLDKEDIQKVQGDGGGMGGGAGQVWEALHSSNQSWVKEMWQLKKS